MPFEKCEDVEAIDNERRKAIAKSIRIISVEELKKLGEEIFDSPDRPWRQTFLSLIAENPGATFYHASVFGFAFLYSLGPISFFPARSCWDPGVNSRRRR